MMMTVTIIFGFHHFSSKKTQNHSQLLLVKLSVRNFYKKPTCSRRLYCFLFVSLKKKKPKGWLNLFLNAKEAIENHLLICVNAYQRETLQERERDKVKAQTDWVTGRWRGVKEIKEKRKEKKSECVINNIIWHEKR